MTTASEQTGADRGIVESVMRATRLLDCFEHGRPQLSLSEFVRRGGYSKTTTYRLLSTLERAGWLERTTAGAFRLTIKSFQLGTILVDSLEPRREAAGVMAALAAACGCTVYLIVESNGRATCLERIDAGTATRVFDLDVGGSQPLHLGAGPRALLAFNEDELLPPLLQSELAAPTPASIADPDALRADLASTRQRGYSISRGDVTRGVAALGAPIFNASGRAVGAISVGGLVHQFEPPREHEIAEQLLAACDQISRRLGSTRPWKSSTPTTRQTIPIER
jgi:DNA-binding IclR family transcriptional regulator